MEVPGDPAPAPVLGVGEVNGEAEEGGRVRARSSHDLPWKGLSNLAFRYLIWEVGGHTFQGSG